MKIKYNVTGAKRKSLVSAISRELNLPTLYLGAPSFSYEVGGYRIDKDGTLEGADNRDLVADLQGLDSFEAVSAEYDTPLPEAEPVPDDIQIPCEAEVGGRISPYRDVEEPPAYDSPERPEADEHDRLTIEVPLDGFTEESIVNLEKLIASKASLIRKAIGADTLPIVRTRTTLQFPWFRLSAEPDEASAYAQFISALCEMAKAQKRVNAKETDITNDKFAFRVFLVRLGFVGDDYKASRRALLRNLSGNSAFLSGKPAK